MYIQPQGKRITNNNPSRNRRDRWGRVSRGSEYGALFLFYKPFALVLLPLFLLLPVPGKRCMEDDIQAGGYMQMR